MNRDKQTIEEMAILFAKEYCNPKGCDCCNLIDEYCDRELSCEDYLGYKRMAETFYEQGYRKSSDVAREIFEEIETSLFCKPINGEIHLCIRLCDYNEYKKKYTQEK